jgi:hypothetical protein
MPGAQFIQQDFYGHITPSSGGVSANFAGAAAGTVPGTIVAGAASNAAAPTAVNANDSMGQFTIVGNAAAAAGILATVFFAQPYGAPPKNVICAIYDVTGAAALVAVANAVAAGLGTGFTIVITVPAAGSHSLLVSYEVNP